MEIIGFTSVLESTYGTGVVSSNSLLGGIKIKFEDNWFLVGDSCKNLGRNPHRIVNASPNEIDFKILFLSSLLISGSSKTERINLSVGFPFSTYNHYRPLAESFFSKKVFNIEYDTSLYKRDGKIESRIVDIENFDIIPELAACVIGLKKKERVSEKNFLMISIGYGTAEIGIVTEEGLNQRTIISVPGIIRCIQNFRDELEKEHFIGFMTDNQLDDAFKSGTIMLDRRVINIHTMKSNILKSYYKEYISDTIRSRISDRDFSNIQKIFVCGGGVHYSEIKECFNIEFERVVPVEIASDPDTLAAHGYFYNSHKFSGSPDAINIGIDLGNSSTYVCIDSKL